MYCVSCGVVLVQVEVMALQERTGVPEKLKEETSLKISVQPLKFNIDQVCSAYYLGSCSLAFVLKRGQLLQETFMFLRAFFTELSEGDLLSSKPAPSYHAEPVMQVPPLPSSL